MLSPHTENRWAMLEALSYLIKSDIILPLRDNDLNKANDGE